jgi:Bacterial extracellular solute-binding proteins, family 3
MSSTKTLVDAGREVLHAGYHPSGDGRAQRPPARSGGSSRTAPPSAFHTRMAAPSRKTWLIRTSCHAKRPHLGNLNLINSRHSGSWTQRAKPHASPRLKTEPSKAVVTSDATESHWKEYFGLLPSRGPSRRKVVYKLVLLLAAVMVTSSVPCAAFGQDQKPPSRFLGNRAIPPFVSLQNGKPVGIVVDLAYALAARARVPIIVEAMDWSAAQAEVLHGEADALLQINPNPQRERVYDFSDPLLDSRFQIFRKVTRTDIQSLESLRGMKVGVEQRFPRPATGARRRVPVGRYAHLEGRVHLAQCRSGRRRDRGPMGR